MPFPIAVLFNVRLLSSTDINKIICPKRSYILTTRNKILGHVYTCVKVGKLCTPRISM